MLIKTTSIHPDVAFPAASVSPAFETYLLRFRALQVCSCCTNTLASYSSRGNEPRFIGIERILRCIHAVRLPVLVWSAYKIHLPEITAVFLLHQYPSFQLFKTRSVSSYEERKRHQMSAMLCGCLPPVISTIKSPSNDHRGLPPVPLHWPLEIQKTLQIATWKPKEMFNDIMRCACRPLYDSQLNPPSGGYRSVTSTSILWFLVVQKSSSSSLWGSKNKIDWDMRCARLPASSLLIKPASLQLYLHSSSKKLQISSLQNDKYIFMDIKSSYRYSICRAPVSLRSSYI